MISAAVQSRIQELFRRENRSFLQYIAQATPWARDADKPVVDKVLRLAAEEMEALENLANWMEANHVPLPYLGAFPTKFMNYNFVDIRKLIGPLIGEQRKELADLEADTQALQNGTGKPIEALVELNRKHLAEMEALEPTHSLPATASAS
jgi:hypothetical protein